MARAEQPDPREELAAEISDRLARRGVKPCPCGPRCSALRYLVNQVKAGLASAAAGGPAAGGMAAMERLGRYRDGRSRQAAQLGRMAGAGDARRSKRAATSR